MPPARLPRLPLSVAAAASRYATIVARCAMSHYCAEAFCACAAADTQQHVTLHGASRATEKSACAMRSMPRAARTRCAQPSSYAEWCAALQVRARDMPCVLIVRETCPPPIPVYAAMCETRVAPRCFRACTESRQARRFISCYSSPAMRDAAAFAADEGYDTHGVCRCASRSPPYTLFSPPPLSALPEPPASADARRDDAAI